MSEENNMDSNMDNIRYELTKEAREWARNTYTRKNIIKDKEKAVTEFVRSDSLLNYVNKLIQNKPTTNSKKESAPQTNTVRKVPVADINYDSYLPRKWGVEYVDIDGETEELETFIMADKDNAKPYLIESEKGMGKTLLINDIALEHNIPLITLSCSSGTRMSDLEGRTHVDGLGSYYQLGIIPTAIELANHFGHAILFLDEINALDNELQKRLNPVLDERQSIYVNGKLYGLNPDCKLSVVAAMNPVTYSGVNTLNEDLKSRFAGRVWNHDLQTQLDNAIDWSIKGQPDSFVSDMKTKIVTLCENMRSLRIQGELSYSLSIRDVKQFVDVLRMFSNGKVFEDGNGGMTNDYFKVMGKVMQTTIVNHKLDTMEERKAVAKLIEDIFGVTL